MDDIAELVHRAEALHARFSALLNDLGEFAPSFRRLHADLDEIDNEVGVMRLGRQPVSTYDLIRRHPK